MTYKNQTTFISSQEVQYLKTSQSAMQDCYDIGGFKCVIQFLVHKSTIEKIEIFLLFVVFPVFTITPEYFI